MEAGTSFALAIDGLPRLLVTCQHLFGPAGGLSKDVPTELMSRFVQGVAVKDALGGGIEAKALGAVFIPEADAADAACDLAAFPFAADAKVNPLTVGTAQADDVVYMAARVREGAPSGTWLFPALHKGDGAPGTSIMIFDDPAPFMPGTSGAPVINREGELVGMVVRFKETQTGGILAILLEAEEIETMLKQVEWPAPKARGLLARLFG